MIDEVGAPDSLRAMSFCWGPPAGVKSIYAATCAIQPGSKNVGASIPLVRGNFLKTVSNDNRVEVLMRPARRNSALIMHFGYTSKACRF
jgi:hypothetical protein